MPKLSADLKEAILRMPAVEKDKLRLVAKDAKLCRKLDLLNSFNLRYISPC